ncbi:putative A40R [Vaccinia virus Copenhagen]|uniref:Protein A40 n=1 Tax=Vaccinia virus (strain Copenhagen) TaxID=10249 RepID=A40_VACCC|nr:RecName: Full=Protein A40 [Vaccinia virus Copenhagen]AAA48171.1 putative A40R [Vaccinia virus Copenhagen]WDR17317.1 putative A40R [Vaccinia virus Copenhagen]WDR17525.1 putative A40R [Vaccinia virus Copenhagen]
MNKPKTDYAGYACCVICGLIVGIIFTATLLKVVERKLVHTPSIDKTIKDAYIREDCPTDWISYNNKCIHLSTDRKTWEEGRNTCKALNPNSDLIKIETPNELSFLRSLRRGYWVGESEILNQTTPYNFIAKNATKNGNIFVAQRILPNCIRVTLYNNYTTFLSYHYFG